MGMGAIHINNVAHEKRDFLWFENETPKVEFSLHRCAYMCKLLAWEVVRAWYNKMADFAPRRFFGLVGFLHSSCNDDDICKIFAAKKCIDHHCSSKRSPVPKQLTTLFQTMHRSHWGCSLHMRLDLDRCHTTNSLFILVIITPPHPPPSDQPSYTLTINTTYHTIDNITGNLPSALQPLGAHPHSNNSNRLDTPSSNPSPP